MAPEAAVRTTHTGTLSQRSAGHASLRVAAHTGTHVHGKRAGGGRRRGVLVDQAHGDAEARQLEGRSQAGRAGPDDQYRTSLLHDAPDRVSLAMVSAAMAVSSGISGGNRFMTCILPIAKRTDPHNILTGNRR
jgi:hypothetical protein